MTAHVARSAARAAATALDVLLPRRCLGCRAAVAGDGLLCPECWGHVRFLGAPQCAVCGVPFAHEAEDDAVCAACLRRPPPFDRARAVFAYDDATRDLVLSFKHADRTHAAPAFGAWLARAGAELTADADLVVPVPLHWTRLFRRRYNQSALLAAALGRAAGLPVLPDALVRRKRTPSQGRLSRAQRRRNLQGAIRVRPGAQARIDGRRVLLIDDVLTTGATVEACARALRAGGAAGVDVLVLGRVLMEGA